MSSGLQNSNIPGGGSGIDDIARIPEISDMDIQVEGMSCQHCVKSVTEAVHSVKGDATVQVSLDSGLVHIENLDETQRSVVETAIEEQGYEIKN